jgi:AmmeMemoRadiSam system protein B
VPVLIGFQHRETIDALAEAIVGATVGRRALLVASTDLSHYFDAKTAASLDGRVKECVAAFDPEGLLDLFEQYPEHERGRYVACGGGAAISVMKAARALGAKHGRVLKYAHSGEVSGDYDGVVGYLAAAFGTFSDAH